MTPSDDLVRMTKEQVEMWRTFATHMEHWMPSTPNPESCPVVLIEPDQLERLCDLALAQLATRAEPVAKGDDFFAVSLIRLDGEGKVIPPPAPPDRAEPQPVAWETACWLIAECYLTYRGSGHSSAAAERGFYAAKAIIQKCCDEVGVPYPRAPRDIDAPPACALGGEPDMRELWKALQDLSFDCFAGIGVRPPSIDVYNRTFAVCQRMKVKYPTIDLPKGVKIECELPDRYALGFQEAREAAKAKAEGRLAYYRGMMQIDEEGAALEIIEDISALEPKA